MRMSTRPGSAGSIRAKRSRSTLYKFGFFVLVVVFVVHLGSFSSVSNDGESSEFGIIEAEELESQDAAQEDLDESTPDGNNNSDDAPPSSSCNPYRLTGEFVDNEFIFTGPCASQTKWFSSVEQVCRILKKFDLVIVGQSTERRLVYTLLEMLRGNEVAFQNDFSKPNENKLFDRRDHFIVDIIQAQEPTRSYAECFSLFFEFHVSAKNIAPSVNTGLKGFLEDKTSDKIKLAIFQSGVYAAAYNGLSTPKKLKATAMNLGKQFDKSGLTQTILSAPNAYVVFKLPNPVLKSHERFSKYNGKVNSAIRTFGNLASKELAKRKVHALDVYDIMLQAAETGKIEFENGKEWDPPQRGGIHLRDSGRILVAQFILNMLSIIADQHSFS